MITPKEYLRAGDIADLTGVSPRTVRRWIADEIIRSVKLGGARLVAKAELRRVLSPCIDDVTENGDEEQGESINSDVIGKAYCKNMFHLFYDRFPECHHLTSFYTVERQIPTGGHYYDREYHRNRRGLASLPR